MGVEKIDQLKSNPFLNGPTEFLVHQCVVLLKSVPQFKLIFGTSIDSYEREDYSYRELPALRFYNETFTKEQESHYITGDLKCDVVLPANIRREETQLFQDTLSAALLQQFRRPSFFMAMRQGVPGLNELGKVFSSDKTLALKVGDNVAPLTQITINFRIDLKEWDAYLESQNRTKDDPFEITLESLTKVFHTMQAITESLGDPSDVSIGSDITL